MHAYRPVQVALYTVCLPCYAVAAFY